jgi:hypothetical protein
MNTLLNSLFRGIGTADTIFIITTVRKFRFFGSRYQILLSNKL